MESIQHPELLSATSMDLIKQEFWKWGKMRIKHNSAKKQVQQDKSWHDSSLCIQQINQSDFYHR